jgi:hypothetical protein
MPIILWDEGWQERRGVIVRVSYRLCGRWDGAQKGALVFVVS